MGLSTIDRSGPSFSGVQLQIRRCANASRSFAVLSSASPRCRQTALWVHRGLSSGCQNRKKEIPMKISARNQLKGTIVDVVKGATTSHIRIDIGGGVILTASITNEAGYEANLPQSKDTTSSSKTTG